MKPVLREIQTKKWRPALTVIVGFGALMVAVLVAAYVLRGVPSPQDVCTSKCKAFGKSGRLEYDGPATSRDQYKEAFSQCRCEF